MKIVTFNVNGIRSAIAKGLIEWMEEHDIDILCVQETKAHQGSVPVLLFESLGYSHHWHSAKRKGYSGVATFSKIEPVHVVKGLGIDEFDDEGRVIRTDLGDLTIVNCYFPNGGSRPERQAYKMRFLDGIFDYVGQLIKQRPNLIVVGDYNIAHRPVDLAESDASENRSGCLPEERRWMDRWFDLGLVDGFRHCWPGLKSFTWWPATSYGRLLKQGWRIDYQSVSESLVGGIRSAAQLEDVFLSDHCPVLLEFEIE